MKKILVLIVLLFFAAGSPAVTLKNLYDVSVEVDSQSGAVRNKAIKEAFANLLVKVTGMPGVLEQAEGKALLSKSKNFVRSFRYQQVEQSVVNNVITLFKDEQEENVLQMQEEEIEEIIKQRLIISFDEKAVGNALWKAQLPVWGKTRPSTLLWVVFQDSEKRMLVGANKQTEIQPYIDEHAAKRGLPLLYPRLDEQDQRNINVTDVWGAFKEPVKMASSSYDSDAVVTARLLLDKDNQWEARWSLFHGEDAEYWRVTATEIQPLLAQGLDELAQRLAKHYVHVASVNDGDTLVYISDVNNVFDYNRINKYLNGLAGVKKAELFEVKANDVVFRLELRSNAKQLRQSIALGSTLASQDQFSVGNQDSRFSYRLKP